MGQPRLQPAVQGQSAGVCPTATHSTCALIDLGQRHHITRPDVVGWSGRHRTAPALCFQMAGRGMSRDHLGPMVARNPEFGREAGGREGPLGIAGLAQKLLSPWSAKEARRMSRS